MEGKDYSIYERVRVVDNDGFTTPVEAFSMLLPKGWQHSGKVSWMYNMQNPTGNGTYTSFSASSADGRYKLEMLPQILWSWSSDQQMVQIMQAGANNQNVFVAEPMGAEQYLRNVFINRELNGGTIKDIKPNNDVSELMQQQFADARNELMQYGAADVQFYPTAINATIDFGSGNSAMVMCGVTVTETTIMNQYNGSMSKSYTSIALRRIIFRYPSNEKDNAEKILSAIIANMHTNTAWKNNVDAFWKQVRQQNNVIHRQRIQMIDAQTKAIGETAVKQGAQNLKNMDANMRSWEQTQASQDKMNTNFIKTIREVETYRDETGVIELSSGYNHAWSRSDGNSFILSNDPNFNPSSTFQDAQWKEMQLVK